MPKYSKSRIRKARRTSRQGGRFSRLKKIGRWLKKANSFLKRTKAVSKIGNTLGSIGVPYASKIGSFAQTHGYGVSPSGGALRRAGSGCCRRRRIVRRRRR